MIHGLGIDTVEVCRIAGMLDRLGDMFTRRVFTDEEMAYCEGMANRAQHYACRMAAKEAFFKALGAPHPTGISWRDISIGFQQGRSPAIALGGKALEWANRLGITAMHLSLTHTREQASAVVLLER